MFLKSKAILLVAALAMSCSFATQASAIGASYEFSADSPSSFLDFSVFSPTTGDSYFLDSPFFEIDPTGNFVEANPNVSGQFSYDTDSPLTRSSSSGDWSFTSYDAENLTVDLSSEIGESAQFNVLNPRSSYSINSTSGRKFFFTSGWDVDPTVTLSGDSSGCNDEFCETDFFTELPVEQFRQDLPELFNNVDFIEAAVFGFDPSSSYELRHVSYAMGGDDPAPGNGSLLESLPALGEVDSAWLSLGFVPADHQYLGIDVVDIQTTDGEFLPQEQEDGIFDFVSELFIDFEANVRYDVSEFTQLPTGTTPFNPVLPDDPGGNPDGGFDFTFEVPEDTFTFVDPLVAIGYDYEVTSGPNFSIVLLPEDIGDNEYDLWLFDAILGEFVDSGIDLFGGVAYEFEAGGVDLFRILGIETSEFLDPDDATAFVTGLQFVSQGMVSVSQTPITVDVAVPSPSSGVLVLTAGIAGMFSRRRNG